MNAFNTSGPSIATKDRELRRKAYIDAKARPAVDMQYIDHAEAIATGSGEKG